MRIAREIVIRFLGAIQFLTVFPVPMATVPYEEAMPFFPLVGGLLGTLAGGLLVLGTQAAMPAGIAAALALGAWVLATGLLHEDGLADVADGIRAGRTPERMLEIMRDSRIGTYGGVALVLATLLRWQALCELAAKNPWFILGVCIAAGAVSRGGLVLLAAIARPVGTGMAARVVGRVPGWTLLAVGVQSSIAASLAGWRGTAPILVGSLVLLLLLRTWYHARLRGVTGDCLGAAAVLVETYILVVGACLGSF
ncbi:MAG: adenosylcobinamide-GDP ribazoletransferase [Bryobacterales bacterium]|nr:adenosylcobinamide-GDP ribazoletransferase [Bryobacterales bacterium]